LELTGVNNHVIRTVQRSSGNYNETFDINNLSRGEYTGVKATWNVGQGSSSGEFNYHMMVLGVYRHSQYNTPAENTCAGGSTKAYITNAQCQFTQTTLIASFMSQVNLNGSGRSINFGDVKREFFCVRQPGAPADAAGRSFRQEAITAACGGGALNNMTVARMPSHPDLGCNDQVFIHQNGVKTVTDLCPVCPADQLDNYTTDNRCAGIADLGNFMTIKIFR
jgi:hypothetical protein